MMDLRFVEREVVDYKITEIIGQPPMKLMKKIKILQWRHVESVLEINGQETQSIWSDWEDVRIEEE